MVLEGGPVLDEAIPERRDAAAEPPDDLPLAELRDWQPPANNADNGHGGHGGDDEPALPGRALAPHVHRSPAEILEQLAPPSSTLRIDYNQHRFEVSFRTSAHKFAAALERPYSQKSFSRCFGDAVSWQDALAEVHQHAWKKYTLLQPTGCVDHADRPQDPGVVDRSILEQLEPEIRRMPPPKVYPRK